MAGPVIQLIPVTEFDEDMLVALDRNFRELSRVLGQFQVYMMGGTDPSSTAYILGKVQATKTVADGSTTPNQNRADFVVPEGATNAQVTINAAIAALPAIGGSVVLLEGTYIIDQSIVLPSNVTLTGQGNGTVIQLKNGINANRNMIVNSDTTNGNVGIGIRCLKIDGNKANQASGIQHGIFLTRGTESNINQVFVINNRGYGIYLFTSSSNNTITGNTCQGNDWDGITLESSCLNNTITGNTCQGISASGIYLDASSSNNTIAGNTCQGNTRGIYLDASSSNNTITGNTCQGISASGIYLDASSSNNTITGNTCQGNLNGIHMTGNSNNNTVVGNTCQGNIWNGIILITSKNNTISGNTCQGNNRPGITLYSESHNNIVTGNTCQENSQEIHNTYDNIFVWGNCDYNNIQLNICRRGTGANQPRWGIRINSADCDGNMVTNNDLYLSGATGSLSDAGSGTITAAGNRV